MLCWLFSNPENRWTTCFFCHAWAAKQHINVMNNPKLNPWKVKADTIATAPYVGHKVAGDTTKAVEELWDDIDDDCKSRFTELRVDYKRLAGV
jgi:hypothetical protein